MRDDVPFTGVASQHAGHGSPARAADHGSAQPTSTPAQGAGGTPSPAPSPAVTSRTANQNICT
jgi:hypothetical protein